MSISDACDMRPGARIADSRTRAALMDRDIDCTSPNRRDNGSADTESYISNRFAAEALFEFSQDFGLGDLFEFVVQRWLEHTNVEYALAQRDRRGVRGDEFADDL